MNMWTENRLVFHSATGNGQNPDGSAVQAGTAAEVAGSGENGEDEAEVARFDVVELQKEVEKSDYSREIKNLALNCLGSKDDNEIELVHKLLVKELTAKEFEKKVKELRKKKRKRDPIETQSEVAQRVHKAGEFSAMSKEKIGVEEAFKKKSERLEGLVNKEGDILKSLSQLLAKYKVKGELTEDVIQKIVGLDPHSIDFELNLKRLLGDKLKDDKKLVFAIKKLKSEQKEAINEIERLILELEQILEKDQGSYEFSKRRYLAVGRLGSMSGLALREGQSLTYLGVSPNLEAYQAVAEITKVDYRRTPSMYYDAEGPFKPGDKEYEEEAANMPFQVYVTVRMENGEDMELTERQFLEWVREMEVVPLVPTLEALNDEIDFSEYGQQLKEGMQLDYIVGRPNGIPKLDTVSITKIDSVNGTITLNKPVKLGNLSLAEEEAKAKPKEKAVLTFGEFAKWFRREKAEEAMSLEEAQRFLLQMPELYKARYPDLSEEIFKFKDNPIEIKAGQELAFGDGKNVKINSVDDGLIKLSNGYSLTPGQFVKFVKDTEAEPVVAKDGAEAAELSDAAVAAAAKKAELAAKKALEEGAAETKSGFPTILNTEEGDKQGFLKRLFKNVTFVSISDVMRFFRTIEDYLKRREERISRRRTGKVGQNLKGPLGTEFKSLNQGGENEEVEKIKGNLKEQGPEVWYEVLLEAKGANKSDTIKACTSLLCESGNFDFYDKRIYILYNNFFREHASAEDYKNHRIMLDGTSLNPAGNDPVAALKNIMDQMYGNQAGLNWFNSNESAFGSEKQKLIEECKNLSGDQLKNSMHNMLSDHIDGKFVPKFRYNGFIEYIIKYGQCAPDDKMFYLLAGYVMPSPNGGYLFSKEQISKFIADNMGNFPHLEFLKDFKPFKEGTTEQSRYEMLKVFQTFKYEKRPGSLKDRFDKEAMNKFLWGTVMSSAGFAQRLSRVILKGDSNIDHDDGHIMLPGLDDQQALQSLGYSRGEVPLLTKDGVRNGLAGFAQYLKYTALMASNKEAFITDGVIDPVDSLRRMFKSFLKVESALTGRVDYEKHQTLSSEGLNSPPPSIGGSKFVIHYSDEVKEVLRDILVNYGVDPKMISLFLDDQSGKTNVDLNKKHKEAMLKFPAFFDSLIGRDGGKLMMEAVERCLKSGKIQGFAGDLVAPNKDKDAPKGGRGEEELTEPAPPPPLDHRLVAPEIGDPDEIMGRNKAG